MMKGVRGKKLCDWNILPNMVSTPTYFVVVVVGGGGGIIMMMVLTHHRYDADSDDDDDLCLYSPGGHCRL